MDASGFDNVKVEKANALRRYRRLRNLTKLIEIFLLLLFFSWTSTRLPFAVKISGQYFRLLIAFLLSPTFIFLLGNLIVITLLAKSGHFSAQSPPIIDTAKSELNNPPESSSPEPETEHKQTVREGNSSTHSCESKATTVASKAKIFERSKSEILTVEKPCRKLQRSETAKCRSALISGEIAPEAVFFADKLSNEEFQRTVEAFIAKQIRFHKEEKKMSIDL